MIVGLLIGWGYRVLSDVVALKLYNNRVSTDFDPIGYSQEGQSKVSQILSILDYCYVDSLNMKALEDSLSSSILSHLDPHSTYLNQEEVKKETEHFNGQFSGVGMYFMVFEDTIYVTGIMPSTPSARAGLMPGDRIVMINDTAFTGDSIKSDVVAKTVRGMEGTQIRFKVKRLGYNELLEFNINREFVPSSSIEAAVALNKETGIIAINSFTKTTYNEFLTKVAELKILGVKNLIVDLRDNGGGILNEVVLMANEFLERDRQILYIEGNKFPRKTFTADGTGSFKDMKLAVLINEFSASASEIFAGAIQDNDRGLVYGRRSFGKGLVQHSFQLIDGSEARVTVARYYIPSGRCIQKPYVKGDNSSYMQEFFDRFSSGEIFNNDSIKNDTTKIYRTIGGRVVYGGGGITPDFFVPFDTIPYNKSLNNLYSKGLPSKFILRYMMNNINKFFQYSDYKSLEKFIDSEHLDAKFLDFCTEQGYVISPAEKSKTIEQTMKYFKMQIIHNRFLGDSDEYYKYIFKDDVVVNKVLKGFQTNNDNKK